MGTVDPSHEAAQPHARPVDRNLGAPKTNLQAESIVMHESTAPAESRHPSSQSRGIANVVIRVARQRSELLTIPLLAAISLVIGLLTVGDYGASWDESSIYAYSKYALGAYRYFFNPAHLPPFSGFLSPYGPAYFMLTDLGARLIRGVVVRWSQVEAWHFIYFLTFLACTLLIYLLCRRWVTPVAALGAALLFLTQPLLWGHAFINPKDLPFMTFFLGSVVLGFSMVDRYFTGRPYLLWLALAAVLLGLTISMRLVAPLAGVFVGIYSLSHSPRRSILLLLAYAACALIASYLTWPYLWGAPIANFISSAQLMANFPYVTRVLFAGKYYTAGGLPWYYVPFLLGAQLTLPLVVLALAGLLMAALRFLRRERRARGPLLLFLGWTCVPLAAVVVAGSELYDNGRQLYFVLPPLFLLAGLAIDLLLPLLRWRWLQAGALLLLLLPGLYGIVRLHPYEYTYYNQLVGGTGGAYGKYELDYWGTSYREAALWLNRYAPPGSSLWVTGPNDLLRSYLRPDLIISCPSDVDCGQHYDYVVSLARWKAEQGCPRAQNVFVVQRRGAVLAVVKQLPPGRLCG